MTYIIKRRDLLSGAAALAGELAAPLPSFGQWPRPGGPRVGPVTLTAGPRTVEVKGRAASVFGITQPDGTAGLFAEVGKPFRVVLNNDTGLDTLVHWHGLTPPWQQDGVPGISAPPVAPGGAASYDFPLTFPGTFWMHSHQGLQEQSLFSAPLIVRDPAYEPDRQEVVLFLHDFSFKSPDKIYAGLRGAGASPAGHAMGQMSAASGNHMQGMAMSGMAADAPKPDPMAGAPGPMPGMDAAPAMRMSKDGDMGAPGMAMDLNDVVYDAFLANDRTLDDPQVVRVERGGRVLLRVINGSAASKLPDQPWRPAGAAARRGRACGPAHHRVRLPGCHRAAVGPGIRHATRSVHGAGVRSAGGRAQADRHRARDRDGVRPVAA